MLKQAKPTLYQTTRPAITPLFGDAMLVLDETPKAISPFGGLAIGDGTNWDQGRDPAQIIAHLRSSG